MKILVLFALLLPSMTFALPPGTWISPIGDRVDIRPLRSGNTQVTIQTSKNGARCEFSGIMKSQEEESDEVWYHSENCTLKVALDEEYFVAQVDVIGCTSYCEYGVNLRISRATRSGGQP